ncbi:unnamed protein product [Adineta ricciae]|uniref:Uncharacterized protein n=1 Tax=Adineta ricciae TaxID=249248 RepID=A0A814FQ08_ADIRI|nr:unnamed protein product [Adineta ricciae]
MDWCLLQKESHILRGLLEKNETITALHMLLRCHNAVTTCIVSRTSRYAHPDQRKNVRIDITVSYPWVITSMRQQKHNKTSA